jgi:hypothetical protein
VLVANRRPHASSKRPLATRARLIQSWLRIAGVTNAGSLSNEGCLAQTRPYRQGRTGGLAGVGGRLRAAGLNTAETVQRHAAEGLTVLEATTIRRTTAREMLARSRAAVSPGHESDLATRAIDSNLRHSVEENLLSR